MTEEVVDQQCKVCPYVFLFLSINGISFPFDIMVNRPHKDCVNIFKMEHIEPLMVTKRNILDFYTNRVEISIVPTITICKLLYVLQVFIQFFNTESFTNFFKKKINTSLIYTRRMEISSICLSKKQKIVGKKKTTNVLCRFYGCNGEFGCTYVWTQAIPGNSTMKENPTNVDICYLH